MKGFYDTLKRTGKVTAGNVYISVFFCLVASVIGGICTLLIYDDWEVWIGMPSAMLQAFMFLLVMVYGFAVFPIEFMQALSMGKTRKHLFAASYLVWMMNVLVMLLLALGVAFLENFVYTDILKQTASVSGVWMDFHNPLVFITILLCVPALILFQGGLVLFFGTKLIFVFLGLFMISMGFFRYAERSPESAIVKGVDYLFGVEPNITAVCLLCLVLGAILIPLSWLMLRKQRVIF